MLDQACVQHEAACIQAGQQDRLGLVMSPRTPQHLIAGPNHTAAYNGHAPACSGKRPDQATECCGVQPTTPGQMGWAMTQRTRLEKMARPRHVEAYIVAYDRLCLAMTPEPR